MAAVMWGNGERGEVAVFEDAELQRVQEFNDTISHVARICLDDTPVELYEDNPTGNAISRFRVLEDFNQGPTFYVAENVAQAIGISGEQLSFNPRVSRGGKNTHHGVFFGDLKIGTDQTVPVAVKPHSVDTLNSCLRDHINNRTIKELGFHTPEPVGYILAGEEETAYSLSLLDETLTTFEGIDWTRFFPDITKDPGMQEMWRKVSQQVAILHSKGNMSHGDLAPRNIATSAEGGVFIIDWERANLSLNIPGEDTDNSLLRSHSDLSILLESMCRPGHVDYKSGIGIFYGKPGDWWQGFCDIFYDEYCEVRRLEAIAGIRPKQGKAQRIQEVEKELQALTQSLREDIEMYQATCAEL